MGVSGRIARFFLDSQLTPLIALGCLLLGLFAVLVTPKEEEPQINVTMANVFIPFPGASAPDVENLVTTPAEQVLSQITGIDHVYSVTQTGLAILTVQFKVGEDRIGALVKLHDTLLANRDWEKPYLGVGEPIVKPKGIDDVPVVALTLWTADPARSAFDLGRVAHSLEVELKRVAGTREVYTLGAPERAVRVLIDPERMSAHGIAVQDLKNALAAASATHVGATLTQRGREIQVQAGTHIDGAAGVRELVLGVRNGRPVFVADVADVIDGPDQPLRFSWIGAGPAAKQKGIEAKGEFPAVTIAISKNPGANAATVADDLLARIGQLRGSLIPTGVEVTVTRNYGETANDKAQKLIQKLIFATLSVVALVWAALGRREAVIVGTAVVLTLAATLFASWAWGFTINRVSLFALIFSIGILVDDAIVVVENIHRRHAIERGELAATIPGAVDEVGGPTILATFTVIAALLPMAFVTGLMGPYMSPIPINASVGMLISLAIAFVVTPWLALRLLAKGHAAHAEDVLARRLDALFTRVLRPFLGGDHGRSNRRKLALGVLAAITIAISLTAFRLVVLKMLPFDNKSEFQVVLDMPTGSSVEKTAAALRDVGAYLQSVPEVTDYEAYAGGSAPINFNGLVRQYYLRLNPEYGDIQVNLTDKHHRERKSHEIAASVRGAIEEIAKRHGAEVKIVEVPPGPPVMSPIVAEIYGPDYPGQIRVAKEVRERFAATPDIVAIDDSVSDAAPKLVLRVLGSKAAALGITQKDVADVVAAGLGGEDVTPVFDGSSKYSLPVRIGIAPERKGRLDDVLKLSLRSADGSLVPLSELVQVASAERDKAIYHKDLLPVVYVVGDMVGKLDSPLYGMFGIRKGLIDSPPASSGPLAEYFVRQPAEHYRNYAIKWDGEWQITYETFRDMGIAYVVGLLLIYLLVVAQFKSYVTPLVIMAPIPLTIIGVMPGHALLGSQFTATSMIGMIALAGIIVRNSILLVDFINLQVAAGVAFERAVIQAGATRAKPIVLTGLAALLGALFILDDPIFNGLAISLIFGIAVSTLLTLVVIPVLYYAANHRRHPATIAS
jgi:multidrug efflux pump subunit AcrB